MVAMFLLRRRKQKQEELVRRQLVVDDLSVMVEPYTQSMAMTGYGSGSDGGRSGNGSGSGSGIGSETGGQMIERYAFLRSCSIGALCDERCS